jgi:hypothetical protein
MESRLRPLRHLACDGTSAVGVCLGCDGLAAQWARGTAKAFALFDRQAHAGHVALTSAVQST